MNLLLTRHLNAAHYLSFRAVFCKFLDRMQNKQTAYTVDISPKKTKV